MQPTRGSCGASAGVFALLGADLCLTLEHVLALLKRSQPPARARVDGPYWKVPRPHQRAAGAPIAARAARSESSCRSRRGRAACTRNWRVGERRPRGTPRRVWVGRVLLPALPRGALPWLGCAVAAADAEGALRRRRPGRRAARGAAQVRARAAVECPRQQGERQGVLPQLDHRRVDLQLAGGRPPPRACSLATALWTGRRRWSPTSSHDVYD